MALVIVEAQIPVAANHSLERGFNLNDCFLGKDIATQTHCYNHKHLEEANPHKDVQLSPVVYFHSGVSPTCRSDMVREKSPSVKARLLMFIFLCRKSGA